MKEVIVNAEDLVCLNKEKLQELIRCKDCCWYDHGENELEEWFGCKTPSGLLHPMPDEFCSRAERKEDADK